MANTENIEAKLCAYIDGDLDAQGRAEIEKHLASNPQHRTLIEQLSKQRDLLRGLPREDAPEEILEALQGHMERSVLLGDADAAETEAMKIHRWPQFAAMAAMVLLTVGLGVVIYFVLPRNGGGNGNYAVVTSQPATVSEGSRFERESVDKLAAADSTLTPAERAREPLLGKAAPAEGADRDLASRAAAAGGEFAGAPAKSMKKFEPFAPNAGVGESAIAMGDLLAAQDRLQNADIARQLKDAPGGLKENAMFVVVSTADPAAAQSQVTSYLADNKITWDAIGHPMPEPIDVQPQDANLARQQRVDLRMKTGAQVQAPEQAKEKMEAKGGAGGGSGAPAAAPANEIAAAENARKQQAQAGVQQEVPASPAPSKSTAQSGTADAGARIGGESPTIMSNVAQPDIALLDATKQQQAQPQLQEQVQQGQLALGQQRAPARRGLIIARSMTKQQAAELSTTLSKQTTVQRAAVYEQQPVSPAMADEVRRSRGLDIATTHPAATTAPDYSFR
ncbi:MAG: zf-HC2 domain-containing protein, partial [Tepidisphaeraceae bacterium]